ncbi:hypothetical protein NPIL_321021 [Nephila pilipes]|uniref:Uncharacterized protein n=1 Tax=Nephila pilipes TaxID=299642 RepID=A0A8X6M9A5_NEPPI|nr:hypothetical protein NPIL_321021 [Nephila pilipes]
MPLVEFIKSVREKKYVEKYENAETIPNNDVLIDVGFDGPEKKDRKAVDEDDEDHLKKANEDLATAMAVRTCCSRWLAVPRTAPPHTQRRVEVRICD